MYKYIITPLKQHLLSIFTADKQVSQWCDRWKFFFILGHGRSGTNFLANLLDQAHGAYIFHEPVLEDFNAYVAAFNNPESARNYLSGFRKKEIYLRMYRVKAGVYGEVNSVLRRHAEALYVAFPDATLIHLVRDGRNVVRSMMSRTTMTLKDPVSSRIYPNSADPWFKHWDRMDRFSRICWYWQAENSYLRREVGSSVQFEKILSSYEYFKDNILEPCHIFLQKAVWSATVVSPRNTTSDFKMPHWEDWSIEQRKTFEEICGDEMEKYGYELKW